MSINIKKKALNVKNGDTYDNFDMFFLGDVEEAVDDWFEDHPEAVTNVADNSITAAKLAPAVREEVESVTDLKSAFDDVTVTGYTETLNTETNYATALSTGYYRINNAALDYQSNSNFSYITIPVVAGEKYQIDKTHNVYSLSQFVAFGVFVDNDNTPIADLYTVSGTPTEEPYDVTVPIGATKLFLNTDYKISDSPVLTTVYKYENAISGYLLNSLKLDVKPVYYNDIADTGKKIKIIAGVIRNSGNGWEYINDSYHEPLNLTSVSVNQYGQLVIDYGFTAKKVLSLVVCPDETFANTYSVGSSVGLSNSVINVYTLPKTIGGLVHYDPATGSWSVTDSDFTSATFAANGNLTLTHEDLTGYPLKDIYSVSADGNGGNVQITSIGYTSMIVRLVGADGNTITNPISGSNVYAIRHLNSRLVNANNIVNAGGNFWIFGVMEID